MERHHAQVLSPKAPPSTRHSDGRNRRTGPLARARGFPGGKRKADAKRSPAPSYPASRSSGAQIGEVSSLESSPRDRSSQTANPVTGAAGSLHPIGQPIISS